MSFIAFKYPFALGASSSGGGGGGGGGGGVPTQVQLSGIADETIAIGSILRLALNGELGLTAGRLVRANAGSIDGSEIVGVATTSGNQGDAISFVVAGSVPVLFSAPPATTENGKTVFVSTSSGLATLSAPSGSGQSIARIGKLFGANGIASTPTIILNIQPPTTIG